MVTIVAIYATAVLVSAFFLLRGKKRLVERLIFGYEEPGGPARARRFIKAVCRSAVWAPVHIVASVLSVAGGFAYGSVSEWLRWRRWLRRPY